MRITLLCIGKAKEPFIKDGATKYLGYLRKYADVDVRELKDERITDLRDAPAVRKKEAARILKALPEAAYVVALDERGREFTSHGFAAFLQGTMERGSKNLVFLVGGALGLDESVTARSHETIALSRWTLTHEMARLVLLEQLYRSFTILTGKTYHY